MRDIDMMTMRAETASLSGATTTIGGERSLIMQSGLLLNSKKISTQLSWGRATGGRTWFRSLLAASPVLLAPVSSLFAFVTLSRCNGSLSEFLAVGFREGFFTMLINHGPRLTLKASAAYGLFILLQAVLFLWLPGPTNSGQRTPAGHLLTYRTNGLSAWVVTHVVYVVLCWYGLLDPGFIPRNWSGLVAAMNLVGFLVTAFAFVKAYAFPTHAEDRKFSGSAAYDFYMGIELNPRLGETFDFKLFTNGRPGMLSWTLINVSTIAYQYQEYGYISPSLVLVTILQTIYVLDFFVNESWYLRTIDIAHDHYGFYLAWGCFCFLPTTYTLQAQYLGLYPNEPSPLYLAAVFLTGIAGYALFRSVNAQKDHVRLANGHCLIWGRPAKFIRAPYKTSDGATHESILLCSGWWGWSRHANYVGDLLLSTAMCALCGTTKVVVWFYAVFMALLLVHRCIRDERRGSAKYGVYWDEYCKRVPWRFVPGIW